MVRQPLLFVTGCLTIQCFDSPPFFNTVRPPQTTYSSLCSTCPTYRTSCHTIGHQTLPIHPLPRVHQFERAFFTLPTKVPGFHSDHRNIAPARLFFWIIAIHKRGILIGSIYEAKASFKVKVPQPWNLSLTGFEPAFSKVLCSNSHLSWWLGYRV